MQLRGSVFMIFCDETSPMREETCFANIAVQYDYEIDRVIDAARGAGWRAYVDGHRRDLCPGHRSAARRRLTLIATEERTA